MEGKSTLTLQDIADHCGVSKMTVSLALRGDPRVKQGTAERVREAAQHLGYQKNPYVSTLMANLRSGRPMVDRPVIAFVNLQAEPQRFRDTNAGLNYLAGAQARAEELGFRLEEFAPAESNISIERLDRIFHTRNLHAVLLGPASSRDIKVDMRWERYAIAKFGFTISYPRAHFVTSDHFQSMELLIRELLKRDYYHISLALPKTMDERVDHRWVGSFLYQKWQAGRAGRLSVYVPGSDFWNRDSFLSWVKKEQPQVVVSFDPRVPEWLAEGGYDIPDDIGFASIDWSRSKPEYSGVNPRPRRTGALAIDLVVEQIHRNEWGQPAEAKCVLVTGEWVEGRTLKTS